MASFTGRRYDEETGLYYYRARYYHPSIGRFMSRDIWMGTLDSPSSVVNKYSYCLNNPIIFSDPYGLQAMCPEDKEEDEIIPENATPPALDPHTAIIAYDTMAVIYDAIGIYPWPPTMIPSYFIGTYVSFMSVNETFKQYHLGKATRRDVWVSRITFSISALPIIGIVGSGAQWAYDIWY